MTKNTSYALLLFLFMSLFLASFSQNEASKWYFGHKAGLDFSTNPPTSLSNGQLSTFEGCSTISDMAGNLLFYTDGDTIWNQQHLIMANGTGLMGNNSSTQSALIVKQPGSSSIYHVFTVDNDANPNGLRFSTVDMSLAAGMGSVTVKNTLLYTPSTEKLTATRHCNGQDVWVVSHDFNTASFRTYLVTSAGVNSLPVISTTGPILYIAPNDAIGGVKLSPNGRKLGLVATGTPTTANVSGLFDFDAATGLISNYLALGTVSAPYGCEFSSDGTKFYITSQSGSEIVQYDLCAGNSAAILSSSVSISVPAGTFAGMLQLAPNGKIYAAKLGQSSSLGVINFPNLAGTACNYVNNGQPLTSGTSNYGLPGFQTDYLKALPPLFTYTGNCSTVSFTSPTLAPLPAGCTAAAFSYTSVTWLFGDPASGTADTSALSNPTHTFSAGSSFNVRLVYNSACGADTMRGTVTLTGVPSLSVTGDVTICDGESTILTARNALTYTWNTGPNSASITVAPNVTTVYTVTGTLGNCSAAKTVTVNVFACTALNENEAALQSMKLYPNPVKGRLQIELDQPGKLQVYDSTGRLIHAGTGAAGLNTINVAAWPAGMYTLSYTQNNKTIFKKFIKLAAE